MKMINEIYLNKKHISSMKRIFRINKALPSIKLERFLEQKVFHKLHDRAIKAKYTQEIDRMHYSYFVCNKNLVNLDLTFLSDIIGKKVRGVSGKLYRFSHKDYTLLHDESKQKPGFDVIFDFTMNWNDSFGGFPVYSNGSGGTNPIPFYPNTFTLIYRKKGIQRFVKYVNNLAKNHKRYLYLGTLETK